MFRKMLKIPCNYSKITVMRHGQTEWNAPRKRIQGQSSDPSIKLSTKGRHEIKRKFAGIKLPDVFICSPLLRCRQTIEEWAGVPLEHISSKTYFYDELKEVDAGLLEGLYVDELSAMPEYQEIWDSWKMQPQHFIGFPEGETLADMQKRVLEGFSKICFEYCATNKELYVVTHGGPMSILKCFLDDYDLSHLWDNPTDNLAQIELTEKYIMKLKEYFIANYPTESVSNSLK